jgi:hypothetical protein
VLEHSIEPSKEVVRFFVVWTGYPDLGRDADDQWKCHTRTAIVHLLSRSVYQEEQLADGYLPTRNKIFGIPRS